MSIKAERWGEEQVQSATLSAESVIVKAAAQSLQCASQHFDIPSDFTRIPLVMLISFFLCEMHLTRLIEPT